MTRFPKVTRVEIGNEIGSTSIIHDECLTVKNNLENDVNELNGILLNLKIENEKLEDTIDKLKTEIESKETQLTEGINKYKQLELLHGYVETSNKNSDTVLKLEERLRDGLKKNEDLENDNKKLKEQHSGV